MFHTLFFLCLSSFRLSQMLVLSFYEKYYGKSPVTYRFITIARYFYHHYLSFTIFKDLHYFSHLFLSTLFKISPFLFLLGLFLSSVFFAISLSSIDRLLLSIFKSGKARNNSSNLDSKILTSQRRLLALNFHMPLGGPFYSFLFQGLNLLFLLQFNSIFFIFY